MDDPGPAPGRVEPGPARPGGQRHLAFFYRSDAEYVDVLARFVRGALARDDAVLVAVPGPGAGPLREALGPAAGSVTFADMAELGRNPGRIIPAVRAFAGRHPGRGVSYLGEPAWPARSAAELAEAARHEALVNLAFAGVPVTVFCPYAPGLPAGALASALQTHPELIRDGRRLASPGYLGPGRLPPGCAAPLPAPPPGIGSLEYRTDLRPVRAVVARYTELAGLPEDRAADLVLAVSELAANTLRHTRGSGTLRAWLTPAELICEVSDLGWITDPLAGRVRPAEDGSGGHGLCLVNQVCDLVELRSGRQGTTVRLHMGRDGR
jgi:anti-sigma regulatory factor (Ser/Thr protein kinase)